MIEEVLPGVDTVTYSYDPQGRLVQAQQGGRISTFAYNTRSRLASATDPLTRTSGFEYDSVGRITKQTLPDAREILYSYDPNGNLLTLTPPGRQAHSFDYTAVDLTEKYTPPVLGADTTITRYEYNKDKQITRVMRPDGGVIETVYDTVGCSTCGGPVGRPKKILFDRGSLNFKYSEFTGNLDMLIAPAGTLSYTYDGSLPKSVVWSGEVSGTVSVEYDNDMRVTSQTVNNGYPIYFGYDQDCLLIQAGDMWIGRELETGRITSTGLGNVTTDQSYSSKGELASYTARYGDNPIFETSYERDSLGRISDLTERMQGITKAMHYEYDVIGRLESVWRNDTLISQYSYDVNGNRVARTSVRDGVVLTDSGTYDAQDRMLAYGNAQYIYSRNGELQKKIEDADTTTYTYDYFGNLVNVQLPNGDRIEYLIDGQNRRVGKQLNGVVVKRWIYSGQLSPVAELDSADNVVARFVGSHIIKNGTTYQLITDHLGSVRLVVDVETGAVAQKLEYDEFGNILSNTNPDFQPVAYAGGLYDSQIKLVRFGARDYDATVGRWTVKDPIGFGGGVSNLYSYVNQNPINWIDLTGRKVTVKSRKVHNTVGVGAHTFVVVSNKDGCSTYSGTNEDGKLGVKENYPGDYNPDPDYPITSSVDIAPPEGMTEAQFDECVKKSAKSSMQKDEKRKYSWPGGDGGKKSGNCHVVTKEIIEGAGGKIPEGYDPPGWDPGF